MRNPRRKWQDSQKWEEQPERIGIARSLGAKETVDLEPDLTRLRALLANQWSCEQTDGLWGDLLSRLVEAAGDPDREAASWPTLGTPLGLEETLTPGGVFPHLEARELVDDRNRLLESAQLPGASSNYESYEQNYAEADQLFWKEVEAGYVEWSRDRAALEATVGKLVPSSVGVIVKDDGRGKRKVRLVHDLRRSPRQFSYFLSRAFGVTQAVRRHRRHLEHARNQTGS